MATALATEEDIGLGLGLKGPGEDIQFVQSEEVQLIERNKERLVREIHPYALTPSLSVSREEHRKIVDVEQEEGEQRAAFHLLDLLVRKPNFLPELLQALRDAKQEDLARFLEQDLKKSRAARKRTIRENAFVAENEIRKQGDPPSVINVYVNCNVQMGDNNKLHQKQLSSTLPRPDEEDIEYTFEDSSSVAEPPPESEQTTPMAVPESSANQTQASEANTFNAATSSTTPDLIEETAISLTPPPSEALDEHEEHKTEVQKLHIDDQLVADLQRNAPVEKLDTWGQSGDICTDGATTAESVAGRDADKKLLIQARGEPVVRQQTLTTEDLKKDELYGYQKELVQLPKEGHNCIIFAPPKSGKTVIAAEVCRIHLASSVPKIARDRKKPLRDAEKLNIELSKRKVLYMVPTRPLLEQVYKKLNQILPLWQIGKKSGFSNMSTPLEDLFEVYDVLVITPQILQNALARGGVDISDITLLIFDECHHAKDDHAYNMAMHTYMKKKHNTENSALPQILGLTATPGSGGKNTELSVQGHILNLCSNLDITRPDCFVKVQTPEHVEEMKKHSSSPVKESVEVCERADNPFTKEIHNMMASIEDYIDIVSENRQRGCQEYLSFITTKLRGGCEKPRIRKSCEYLIHYNRGLELAQAVQLKDGLQFITDQHQPLERRAMEGELDDTEMVLLGIYQSSLNSLREVARKEAEYPNPLLQMLKEIICRQHKKEDTHDGTTGFRGIVFVKMKITAQALKQWVLEDKEMTFLKPDVFLGKGNTNETIGLSDSEQAEIVQKFAEGKCNILFSTSVGEEGIHIEDCNVAVRYDHVRDDVSMTQAGGRARAKHGLSVVIANKEALQKDKINVYRETLVKIVIDNLGYIPNTEFHQTTNQYQREHLEKRQNREREQMEQTASCVEFYCKGCGELAFNMLRDVRKYESHYVNPDPAFKDRITTKVNRREHLAKHGVSDTMYCKSCGQMWGGIVDNYPNPGLKNFLVEVDDGAKLPFSKWSKIPGASQIRQL